MRVSTHVGWDTTGVDVLASLEQYATIYEREIREHFGDQIASLSVRVVQDEPLKSIAVYGDEYMDHQVEEDLEEAVMRLGYSIADGDYGDWYVPSTEGH